MNRISLKQFENEMIKNDTCFIISDRVKKSIDQSLNIFEKALSRRYDFFTDKTRLENIGYRTAKKHSNGLCFTDRDNENSYLSIYSQKGKAYAYQDIRIIITEEHFVQGYYIKQTKEEKWLWIETMLSKG